MAQIFQIEVVGNTIEYEIKNDGYKNDEGNGVHEALTNCVLPVVGCELGRID
jgi:hypothetical protein